MVHTYTHTSVFPTRILNGEIMLASIKTSFLAAKFNDLFLLFCRRRRAEIDDSEQEILNSNLSHN